MLPCPSIVQNVLAADLKGLWEKNNKHNATYFAVVREQH